MKQGVWWSPESAGTLLSHRWVQAFVYKLPNLRPAELEASLRYKVQATLPVKIEDRAFRTQLFRHRKQTCGAAFLGSENAKDLLPKPARGLRVGVPLVLPTTLPSKVLMFLSTPEGLAPYYYEDGLLKTSFAPIEPQDIEVRARVLGRCPDAEIVGLAPDAKIPLPPGLAEKEPAEGLRAKLLDAFPFWDTRPPRKYPLILGTLLLAAGITLCTIALLSAWSSRVARNEAWKAWLKKTEVARSTASIPERTAAMLKARGAPVPELFTHLSKAWGNDTRIIELEWTQGKLTLTATSSSGLTSLRRLTADPWFRNIRVDEIRTQKDGTEIFTIEGALEIDF